VFSDDGILLTAGLAQRLGKNPMAETAPFLVEEGCRALWVSCQICHLLVVGATTKDGPFLTASGLFLALERPEITIQALAWLQWVHLVSLEELMPQQWYDE
jgi:hypothetical protein